MSIPPAKRRRFPNAPSPIVLPDELVAEVLSFLSVKSLTRLRCVSKSWNSLISDPFFVKIHLQRSVRNPHLLVSNIINKGKTTLVPFHLHRLLDNPSITLLDDDPYYQLKDTTGCNLVVGSCNGLLCLIGNDDTRHTQSWLRFWNPATRIISERLGFFSNYFYDVVGLSFGYDNSTATYKVVAFGYNKMRVFSLGDNVWRDILSFPVISFHSSHGVYLSNSLIWFVDCNNEKYPKYYWNDLTVDQFVFISLDLATETYTQFLPPQGFHELPHYEPNVSVLMDHLCFSHDSKRTYFVIWKMTEFGVEDSWIQFLKISYQNIQSTLHYELLPLHLFENGDILIRKRNLVQLILHNETDNTILYNRRDNTVENIRTTYNFMFWDMIHVESLVSTY